jgi:hypothetical protein
MTLRIVGALILVAGVIIAGLGAYGALRGPASAAIADALARTFESPDFIYSSWLSRWRLWGVGIAAMGGAIAVGGTAVLLRRNWGLLLVAAALLATALVPWIVHALSGTRYAFERPDTLETIVYLALSGIAAFGYYRLRSAN